MRRGFTSGALLLGLAVGLALSLVYTWGINPVELTNTYPALLRTDHRHDWIRLAALSYAAGDSLERTRARLEGLESEDLSQALEPLFRDHASGRSPETLRRLTTLATALDVKISADLIYREPTPTSLPTLTSTPTSSPTAPPSPTFSPTPSPTVTPSPTPPPTLTPSPTLTPTATLTPTQTITPTGTFTPSPTFTPSSTPTPTATPTPSPTFTPSPTPPLLQRLRFKEKEQLCDPEQPLHVEVVVQNEDGEGVPGIEVWLTWAEGADRAVTGLKPDEGMGYVDFNADPRTTYTISAGELGMPLVSGLQLETCPTHTRVRETILGSWRVVLAP